MYQRIILSILLAAAALISFAPVKKTGIFDNHADVGSPRLAGSSVYDSKTKEYTLKGSGYNIWFERDEFQYLFKEIKGDFSVTADFELVGNGKDPHRKVGWMVRESLDADAAHLSAVVHGDGLTVLQWRVAKGLKMRDPEDEIFSAEKHTQTVQLKRRGDEYTMSVAPKGGTLQVVGSHKMPGLQKFPLVGLYICSHNPDVIEEAKVRNVKIIQGTK